MASSVTVAPTLGNPLIVYQFTDTPGPGYDAIDFRRMFEAAHAKLEGAYDATGWAVAEAAVPNMTVIVAADVGLARVDGTSVDHQAPYVIAPHSDPITLDVTTADATNPRIDLVVLQVRDDDHDGSGAFDARVRIINGTPTSGATKENGNGAATLPDSTLLLARVQVPANDTTISQSQILDFRLHAGSDDIGELKMFAGTTVPTGWKTADATYTPNRLTHARAFAALSTLHGVGDGSTTFGLPDARGRSLVGKGTHADVDTVGDSDGLAVASRSPNHAHTHSHTHTHAHTHTFSDTSSGASPANTVNTTGGAQPVPNSLHTHDVSGTTSGVSVTNTSTPSTTFTGTEGGPFLVGTPGVYVGSLGAV